MLGSVLKHIDENTYLFIVSDHGIKPLREFEETDPHMHMDHEKTTPVIAKHDFADGDEVPGTFFAMGPKIKHDLRLMGLEASVYDITPTILSLYGIEAAKTNARTCADSDLRGSGERRGAEIGSTVPHLTETGGCPRRKIVILRACDLYRPFV